MFDPVKGPWTVLTLPTDQTSARLFLRTFTGRLFDPALAAGEIDIRDIAHALAQTCRFGGHVRTFFSVAQHSVLVSERAEAIDQGAGLWGLLHDASEAYLLDIPTPLKLSPLFAPYRELEAQLQTAIYQHFGCVGEVPGAVVLADEAQLAVEFRDLMPELPGDAWRARAAGDPPLRPMTCAEAESAFLSRFCALTPRRHS